MKKNYLLLLMLLAGVFTFSSCGDDDPEPQEVTVNVSPIPVYDDVSVTLLSTSPIQDNSVFYINDTIAVSFSLSGGVVDNVKGFNASIDDKIIAPFRVETNEGQAVTNPYSLANAFMTELPNKNNLQVTAYFLIPYSDNYYMRNEIEGQKNLSINVYGGRIAGSSSILKQLEIPIEVKHYISFLDNSPQKQTGTVSTEEVLEYKIKINNPNRDLARLLIYKRSNDYYYYSNSNLVELLSVTDGNGNPVTFRDNYSGNYAITLKTDQAETELTIRFKASPLEESSWYNFSIYRDRNYNNDYDIIPKLVKIITDNPSLNPAVTATYNFSLTQFNSNYYYNDNYYAFSTKTGNVYGVDNNGLANVDFVLGQKQNYNYSDTVMLMAPTAMTTLGYNNHPFVNGRVCHFKKSNLTRDQFRMAGDAVVSSLSVNTLSPTSLVIKDGDIIEIMTQDNKKGLMTVDALRGNNLVNSNGLFLLKVQR